MESSKLTLALSEAKGEVRQETAKRMRQEKIVQVPISPHTFPRATLIVSHVAKVYKSHVSPKSHTVTTHPHYPCGSPGCCCGSHPT